jgi:hypothetical protein
VIAAATQHLIGGLFELADLGGHELKGFGAKVRAWRVVGDSRAESRFAARSASGLTPFFGRQHELGTLLERACINELGGNEFSIADCQPAAEYAPTADAGDGMPEPGDLVSVLPATANPAGDPHAPFMLARSSRGRVSTAVGRSAH